MSAGRLIRKIPAEGMAPDANPQTRETHGRSIHTLDGTIAYPQLFVHHDSLMSYNS